jgi:type IV pilus assembly protein PilW
MTNSNKRIFRNADRRQQGFTLVELMVSTTIAVFLLGGLLVTLQSTRQAYGNQNALAQLQDNERLALTLMADVIESGGYYPDPVNQNPTLLMPLAAPFAGADQAFFGTSNAAAPGDTITVQFAAGVTAAGGTDNALNCIGQTNPGAAAAVISTFSIKTINNQNQLICTFKGTDYPLITSGVQNLQILYGVQKNGAAATGSCTDTYLKASQMVTADWNNVCSVSVTLTFDNPVKRTGIGAQSISISRVIAVMSKAGP